MHVKHFEIIKTHYLILFFFYGLLILTHMNFWIREFLSFSLCNLKSILSKTDKLFPLFQNMPSQFGLNSAVHWIEHHKNMSSPKSAGTKSPYRKCHLSHDWTSQVDGRKILGSYMKDSGLISICGIWSGFLCMLDQPRTPALWGKSQTQSPPGCPLQEGSRSQGVCVGIHTGFTPALALLRK